MNTEKKFQSVKEVENAVQELEQNQPWRLITQRVRLYERIVTTFHSMFPLPAYPIWVHFSPEIVMFLMVLLVFVKVISSWWMLMMFIYVPYAIFGSSVVRAFRIRTFLKNKPKIINKVKLHVLDEIAIYESSIASSSLDEISQQDPIAELTPKQDSRYGYMSPTQLRAFWQEQELPRRQQQAQAYLDNLNRELAYIRKEVALLEEIEKS